MARRSLDEIYNQVNSTKVKRSLDDIYNSKNISQDPRDQLLEYQKQQSTTSKIGNFLTKPLAPAQGNLGDVGRLAANIPTSAVGFGVGVAKFLNPVDKLKSISQVPGAVSGANKDVSAMAEGEANVTQSTEKLIQAIHKKRQEGGDTTHLVGMLKQLSSNTTPDLSQDLSKTKLAGHMASSLIPSEAPKHLVESIKQYSRGNKEAGKTSLLEAEKAFVNNPVGETVPYFLFAKQIADSAGYGSEFDATVSKVTKPISTATKLGLDYVKAGASKVGEVGGNIGAQALGLGAKGGAESVKQGFQAGLEGGEAKTAFTQSMRGQTSESAPVESAQTSLSKMYEEKSTAYQDAMGKIKVENPKSLDISPMLDVYEKLKSNFNVRTNSDGSLDFSRSSLTDNSKKVEAIDNLIKDWGSQKGDRTVQGIDLLKQNIRNFRGNDPSLNKYVSDVANSVQDIIRDVPGYKDVMSKYGESMDMIKDIQKDLSTNDKATVSQGFKKLTGALKQDNQLKIDLIQELSKRGDPNLLKQIAGMNFKNFVPTDIFRGGIDLYAIGHLVASWGLDPIAWAELLSTSPRAVGEFVQALGSAIRKAKEAGVILKGAADKAGGMINKAGEIANTDVKDIPLGSQEGFAQLGPKPKGEPKTLKGETFKFNVQDKMNNRTIPIETDVLYHGTQTKNLTKISKEGLKSDSYLTSSIHIAGDYSLESRSGVTQEIIRIDPKYINEKKLFVDEGHMGIDFKPSRLNAFLYKETIPPEALQRKIGNSWESLISKTPSEFKGFKDITTTILDKLKGKSVTSKQEIMDFTNSGDIKQAERDVIRNMLKDEGDKVNVKEFADKVKTELLPLKRMNSNVPRYESVSLPEEVRGNVVNYKEHIYNSSIKTSAGDVHFGGLIGESNYFAHTRVEDVLPKGVKFSKTPLQISEMANGTFAVEKQYGTGIVKSGFSSERAAQTFMDEKLGAQSVKGDTRRVIELQSDLFQKGNLEREAKTLGERPNVGPNDKWEDLNVTMKNEYKNKANFEKIRDARESEISKLEPYRNTWHERVIREEVKQAAVDGKTKLQFPTGETAMKIEGLGERTTWADSNTNVNLKPEHLKVGKEINADNDTGDWIITDVLGDGKFKAVQKSYFEGHSKEDIDSLMTGKHKILQDNFESNKEQFDISGKIDTENPIYKFYEKEVGRYLKNKFNAIPVTDKQGVKWWQIDIKPEMKNKPINAFSIKQQEKVMA